MNIQSNMLIIKKIAALKNELNQLCSQIENERMEGSEENPSLQDLLDKKEILLSELESLENPGENIIGNNFEQINKTYQVTLNGQIKKLKVVIPAEADPSAGLISPRSPLAQALNGKKVGDTVEVQTPMGILHYNVKFA